MCDNAASFQIFHDKKFPLRHPMYLGSALTHFALNNNDVCSAFNHRMKTANIYKELFGYYEVHIITATLKVKCTAICFPHKK